MGLQESIGGGKLRWFYSFGTLKEYICQKTFSLDFDIDLSVIFGECEHETLIKSFEGSGYKLDKVLLNDKTNTPLNVQFRPHTSELKGSPNIDVYFWLKRGNVFYHTYDVEKEGKKIPKEYVFKGIEIRPEIGLDFFASDKVVNNIITKIPEGRENITEKGVWSLDIFGDHSGNKFYAPYAYGYCLDVWYYNWRFRKFHNKQSKTEWWKRVKSCKDL